MKQKGKTLRLPMRIAALALAVVLLAVFLPSLRTHASAFTSLNHIESIKANQSTFNIVEIVPQANTGSIGYYVDGYEPTSNYWMTETAKLVGAGTRANYANGIFKNLQDCGILGSGTTDTTCPLTYVGPYAEKYPWEDMTGAATLTLANPETVVLGTSTFVSTGVSNGEFVLNSTANFVGSGNGDYAQNIDSFIYQADPNIVSADAANYYYDIANAFTKINFDDPNNSDTLKKLASGNGTAIYTPVYKTDATGAPTTEIDHYLYAGTLGAGFMLDVTQTYFYVDAAKIGAAHKGSDAVGLHYYSVTNSKTPYVEVGSGSGCFSMNKTNFEYVGAGAGDYSLTSTTSGDSHTVTYRTIKVTGGYMNNDWLLKDTFDADDTTLAAVKAKMKIQVFSVSPDVSNAETTNNITGLLNAADLIVLSDGLNLSGGGAAGGYSSGHVDLTSGQIDIITSRKNAGTAVLLDSRIAGESAASNIKTYAANAIGSQTIGFVSGSLYCFTPDADRPALATKNFTKAFSDYTETTSPYYTVYSEISYENFLRKTANSGTTDTLPPVVDIATCVRYIINYSGQRVVNNKGSINVLDVEPLTQSSTSGLTKATVLSWLPADSDLSTDDITITTMSTAEFISKIEDINEVYDLVYIGASLYGFNTTGTGTGMTTVYNDSTNMNGLIYSNVGDTYQSGLKLSGLLDRDFATGSYSTFTGGDGKTYHKIDSSAATAYRLSGNDINQTKLNELTNFARSGFPIIVSNALLNAGTDAAPAYNMSVSLTGTYSSGYLTLAATVNTDAKGKFIFNWYRKGSDQAVAYPTTITTSAAGGTSASTSISSSSLYEDDYYCSVSYQSATGGSSTTATSNTVTLKGTYTLSASGTADPIYPVEISGSQYHSYDHYVVYPSPILGTVSSYQWQYQYNGSGSWRNYNESGGTSKEIYVDYYDYNYGMYSSYRCIVTAGGKQYVSQSAYWDTNYGYCTADNNDTSSPIVISVSIATGEVAGGVKLSASPSSTTYHYQWYRKSNKWRAISGATSSVYTVPLSDINTYMYYCEVSVGNRSATSANYTISYGWSATNNSDAPAPVTIPAVEATDATVNTDRVDNCSNMYTALNTLLPYANVMTGDEAAEQQNTLLKYLNLSKPSIDFTVTGGAKPTEYAGVDQIGTSLISNNTLTYTFSIRNTTDATPLTTRYTCELYLDQNADGRYMANEELTDLLIKDSDGNAVEASQLAAGKTYTVTRKLPSTYSGIIPWHLKITKVGAAQIHTSATGYTYIMPSDQQKTTINVLQVRNDSSTLNISSGTDGTSTFKNLYSAISNAYVLNVKSITISQLNNFIANSAAYNYAADINKYLDGYDMLVMGFADCYGDLNKTSADAVVNYIKSGKAILFTHDTTSFSNLPVTNYQTTSGSTIGQEWGYYFNTILRDPVGLDRYGVTNPTFGITKYSLAKTTSGLVANGYTGLGTTTAAQTLTDAGYSIAYEPKSGKTDTVSETQGFTKYELVRYSADTSQKYPTADNQYATGGSNNLTTSVSQVNKGQITTYPFNINTTAFSNGGVSIGDTLTVAETHDQYYQLNMNSNDVVVWYCLSGNHFINARNDGVNAYYIYNRGNVTYSGAGHTPGGIQGNEAKLFVNTMIAAYRAAAVDPTFDFKSPDDTVVSTQFVPIKYTSTMDTTNAAGTAMENAKIYFKISDTNLSTDKQVSVAFYYSLGDLTLTDEQKTALINGADPIGAGYGCAAIAPSSLIIHRADNDAVATASDVHSDTLYYFTLPDSVLNEFAESDQSVITLLGKVTTTIGTKDYIGVSTMQLKKLGFMSLR